MRCRRTIGCGARASVLHRRFQHAQASSSSPSSLPPDSRGKSRRRRRKAPVRIGTWEEDMVQYPVEQLRHNGATAQGAFAFEVLHQSRRSRARVGRLHTPHGAIETPCMVPVGTHGTLKMVDPVLAADVADVQVFFVCSYHMEVLPGCDVIGEAGGLHKWMGWKRPLMTDSGGFQVFSLRDHDLGPQAATELKGGRNKGHAGSVLSVRNDGVRFRSYWDGREIYLTPQSVVKMQHNLGADIIIPLDELLPLSLEATERATSESFARTHSWERQSLWWHLQQPTKQAMYAVIHGGVDERMRAQSVAMLSAMPFDGVAVGGSMGQDRTQLMQVLDWVLPQLSQQLPNHILGIGDPESVEGIIKRGADTFDSSYPTRLARHGNMVTRDGGVQRITKSEWKRAFDRAVDPKCTCYMCSNYSAAYMHHLFKAKEATGPALATLHNVHYYMQWMERLREAIAQDRL